MTESRENDHSEENLRCALAQVERALRGLLYGEVAVIVQDGLIVQINRTERLRIQRDRRRKSGDS